ncbi:MAG: PASTA domain-containing protein [Ignavibacteria bacterium]|nr:PASTA domain-containing protein [Ignavibacteria bacterium]
MAEPPPHTVSSDPPQTANRPDGRVLVLKLFFLVFFVIVAGRLVQVQLLEAPKYQTIAKKQHEQTFALPPVRGSMFDRHGNVLVSNSMFVSLAADPKMVGQSADRIATRFSRVFGKPRSYYLERLRATTNGGTKRRFVWLERRVTPELGRKIEADRLDGIVVINEAKRLYHYDELASSLLGLTDVDNNGIAGLETQFNELLKGKSGSVTMQRDGFGRARPSADYPRVDPVDGDDIILTIDLAYQAIAEEELKKGIEKNKADGGIVIMLDPRSGAILAMANQPSMNPNAVGLSPSNIPRNRALTDVFEPGSLFKIVTTASAYEYKLINPGRRYNAEGGKYRVFLGGNQYRLITDTKEYDVLTFQEGFEVSSNIVMAKASEIIGAEKLYRQARDMGFGIPTGIELPGEVRGRLKKPHEWSKTTLNSLSYGYEISCTPLQMVVAYSAIANKGILMKPSILAEVRKKSGDIAYAQTPQKIRRVVSEETAALLAEAMEGVVERGTGTEVKTSSVRIGGKTGTSRRIVDGRYVRDSHTASFVGYFPLEDPQIVCLVMLDNPRTIGYYGGITAGPVFRRIAERIVQTSARFSGQRTVVAARKNEGPTVPDLRNLQPAIATKILEGNGLGYEVFGSGEIVVKQSPNPGTRIEAGAMVHLVLNVEGSAPSKGSLVVPDVRGMSVRRAINRLVVDDFDVSVQGSGIVRHQVPPPMSEVAPGSKIRLQCEPRSTLSAALY